MTGRSRQRILVVAAALTLGLVGLAPASPRSPSVTAAALPAWTGSIDLYRPGTFTTQKSWLWCTAADLQIIANIVNRTTDHAASSQGRYFDWMRARNRYDIPERDGVDPAGWTAGLRTFVDDRYRLTASRSFDAALRSAVTSLRKTGLPVGLTVAHGSHAWVLTGFSATADPAATARFDVTTVRIVGPLWGLQSRSFGYDMRPNTELTRKQLAGFFTPWHYARIRMAWEGRWVSVQPTGAVAAPTAPAPPSSAVSSSSAVASSRSAPSSGVAVPSLPPPPPSPPVPEPAPVVERTASAVPTLLLIGAVSALGLGAALVLARARRVPRA
jgi:hypothetical protein